MRQEALLEPPVADGAAVVEEELEPEPFEPESFEPEPFEPESFEPEPFEPSAPLPLEAALELEPVDRESVR
jgi:hypothetical protein